MRAVLTKLVRNLPEQWASATTLGIHKNPNYLSVIVPVFLCLANYHHFFTFKNLWLPIEKEKRVEFIFWVAKWTWTDEDGPKGIRGRFGFVDLNSKGFAFVVKMR
jgi:hypothetical protein